MTEHAGPDAISDDAGWRSVVGEYGIAFQPGLGDGDELIVSVGLRAVLPIRVRPLARDALHLCDSKRRYYLSDPQRLADVILAVVDRREYRKILLVGTSKAGFAALMFGGLCARARPALAVRVLAFGPLVRLFPYDRSLLAYPSYAKLRVRSRRRPDLARTLRRFGDLSHLNGLDNFFGTVVYAERNHVDRLQARRLEGPNFRLVTVDASTHETKSFFIWRGLPETDIAERLERLYAKEAVLDADLAATRPADIAALAKAVAEGAYPTYDELVDGALAAERTQETHARRLQRRASFRATLTLMAFRRLLDVVRRRMSPPRKDVGPQTFDPPQPAAALTVDPAVRISPSAGTLSS